MRQDRTGRGEACPFVLRECHRSGKALPFFLSSCALDGPAFYRSSICFVITAGVFSSLAASDLFWPFIPCSPPPLPP